VTLRGYAGGRPYEKRLQVVLPAWEESHAVLGPLWARARVDELMSEDLQGAQTGNIREDLKEEIVQVALEHRIMTQYTSFVAVEDRIVTEGGAPRTVTVPVEMPEGVTYEGVFGKAAGDHFAGPAQAMRMSHKKGVEYMRRAPMPAGVPATGRLEESEDRRLARACIAPEEPTVLSRDLRQLIADPSRVPAGVEVRNGKVTVEVRLDSDTADLVRRLKKAGLRIVFRTSLEKKVTGTIDIGKLEALARVKGVLAVTPGRLN
jgi:Ca-activated chloride channel family protein